MKVAFIPVRGGSKGIPYKNMKKMLGKPLVYWSAKACVECEHIDKVYIATDSTKIKRAVDKYETEKLKVIYVKHMDDECMQEDVMIPFARENEFDDIVLLQATSPLTTSKDLDGGFEKYYHGYDSVVSVTRQKRLWWREDGTPVNYDPKKRPRRTEQRGILIENGAFFITSRKSLLVSGCRMSGKIGLYEMNEDTYFEIDEPSDWIIVEQLLKERLNE